MRAFTLLLCYAISNAKNGWDKFRDEKQVKPPGGPSGGHKFIDFPDDDSFNYSAYFDNFNKRAANITIKANRIDKDLEEGNIKFGFDMLRNATKSSKAKLTPGHNGKKIVNITGLMFNKNVIDAAREKQPRDKRRQFDKDISKEGQKSRIAIAKNLIDNGEANTERKYDTPNMKLFIHRANKDVLTNKYLGESAGSGAFKLQDIPVGWATAVVHELREGDGHWGREANKYQVKSKVIGMQLLRDNGTAIEMKGLASPISIRFPNVSSSIVGECVWWDIEYGVWSTIGCTRTINPPDDGRGAECKCNHLTEFAIAQEMSAANATDSSESSGLSTTATVGIAAGGAVVATGALAMAFVPDFSPF